MALNATTLAQVWLCTIEKHMLHGRFEAACDVFSLESPEAQAFAAACPKGAGDQTDPAKTATFLVEEAVVRLMATLTNKDLEGKCGVANIIDAFAAAFLLKCDKEEAFGQSPCAQRCRYCLHVCCQSRPRCPNSRNRSR